jgi:hypothetical protein
VDVQMDELGRHVFALPSGSCFSRCPWQTDLSKYTKARHPVMVSRSRSGLAACGVGLPRPRKACARTASRSTGGGRNGALPA